MQPRPNYGMRQRWSGPGGVRAGAPRPPTIPNTQQGRQSTNPAGVPQPQPPLGAPGTPPPRSGNAGPLPQPPQPQAYVPGPNADGRAYAAALMNPNAVRAADAAKWAAHDQQQQQQADYQAAVDAYFGGGSFAGMSPETQAFWGQRLSQSNLEWGRQKAAGASDADLAQYLRQYAAANPAAQQQSPQDVRASDGFLDWYGGATRAESKANLERARQRQAAQQWAAYGRPQLGPPPLPHVLFGRRR